MTIEQTNAVDYFTLEDATGDVLLTISDHLDWVEQESRHLLLLQNKLNSYLMFIESGEMQKKFPESIGRNIVINLVGKFPLSEKAIAFFKKSEAAIAAAGFRLRFKLHPAN